MKKQLISIIRRARLAHAADKCRFYTKYLQFYFANKKMAHTHRHFIFPPPYYLYETYALNYKDYYEDGLGTAIELIDFIKPYMNFTDGKVSILDWGCGPGRIVRHLPLLLPEQNKIYGCDYNSNYINWCKKNIPAVSFLENDLLPPAGFSDNSFDWIYGLSILTHLSLQSHQAWIEELFRILKPGGLLLITTHGEIFKEKLGAAELAIFNSGELVIRTSTREGHRTFAAFHPEKFMQGLLSGFEIIEYLSGGSKENIAGTQDMWLVKKPVR